VQVPVLFNESWPGADMRWMASPPGAAQRVGSATRTGVMGTIVAAFAFFDGVFVGTPVALLAASLGPLFVFVVGVIAVSFLSIACCRWVDRRWDDWLSGHGKRTEKKLETIRASRLMRRPVAWIQRGTDGRYALAAALANPILVVALARSVGGKPVGERRIVFGSVAYAIPYVAIWSLVGLALGDTVRAA
jgi:hypothetical protein